VTSQPSWHRPLADGDTVLLAAALAMGVWQQRAALALVVVGGLTLVGRARAAVCCAVAVLAGGALGGQALAAFDDPPLGRYTGPAIVVADPLPVGRGLRVTLEIEGRRYDSWVYGSPRRRLSSIQVGDRVLIDATRQPLSGRQRAARVRHVVAGVQLHTIGDVLSGSPLDASNRRVRQSLRSAAESVMRSDHAALFTGLVIGDDARQSPSMVAEFRASGLSHLTAVSGQNVAFVIAAAGPLLRRLRPWWRWSATTAMILWFMALTRFEPSVLRAGLMAMVTATAFVTGRPQAAVRALSLTIIAAVCVDPMLVWSVGFWLSVGATAGTVVLSGPVADRLPVPSWLALPLGTTLAAQVGVALPSLLVFGRLPLVSLLANVLAVPVAGAVMLYGLPAGLLAGAAPWSAEVVLWPAEVGTRWVATVASLGARLEIPAPWNLAGWALVLIGLATRCGRGRCAGEKAVAATRVAGWRTDERALHHR
jgi:competence protein ComEC